MAKRGSNIYLRKDGRYEGRVSIGYTESGRVRYKSVYAHTLAEVKQKMEDLYSLRDTVPVTALRLTVQEACEQWLAACKLRVKESSYAIYRNTIRNHILPQLGKLSFAELNTAKLNTFISEKLSHGRLNRRGGLSAKTVRDIMTVYRSVEHYASREFGVRETHFTMPKSEQKQLDILSKCERNRLERFLVGAHEISCAGILLCMYTGLRIGELCGLKWADIDFTNGTVSVKRTVQRVNCCGSSEVRIGAPKSRRSIRQIPVPEFVLKHLLRFRAAESVFVLSGQTKPIEPRTMQNRFAAILKRCNVRKVNFHLLRHTYASVCIELGFDVKTLSELLGHADASLTLNRYVHSSLEQKKKYVERFTACA